MKGVTGQLPSRRRAYAALLLAAACLLPALMVSPAMARQGFAAITVDARSGRVLYAHNADAPRIPASITKVMTIYELFTEIRRGRYTLSSKLVMTRDAARRPPSKLYIKPGRTFTVDQAIRALITKSANDVAAAVAANISGSESAFARRMTRTARRLGMTRTTFRNASGLPTPPNVSTARDLATLALRIQRDFPKLYRKYFAIKHFRHGRRVYRNHNRLLWRVAGMDGLKTGYTRAAGFNLAASVRRDGRRIVAVVLGAPTSRARNATMARLIERTFRTRRLTRGVRIAALAGRPPGLAAAWRARPPVRVAHAKAAAKPAIRPQRRPAELARRHQAAPRPKARQVLSAGTAGHDDAALRALAATTALPPLNAARRPASAPAAKKAKRVIARTTPPPPADAKLVAAVTPDAPPAVMPGEAANTIVIAKTNHDARPAHLRTEQGAALVKSVRPSPNASEPAPAAALVKTVETRLPDAAPTAPRRPAASARKAAPPPTDSWMIQLGAFPAEEGAKTALREVRRRHARALRGKTPFTMVFRKNNNVYYRARFAGFDRKSALRACRELKRRGQPCLALAPRG